jgi:hypothetical protein
MKILKFDMYKDGGTIEIVTDEGIYCFDDRLFTKTKGRLYNDYPKDDNSNLIENSTEIEKKIINALKEYDDDFYNEQIKNLIHLMENVK